MSLSTAASSAGTGYAKSVTASSGATLSPGGDDTAGTICTDDLTLGEGSQYSVQINDVGSVVQAASTWAYSSVTLDDADLVLTGSHVTYDASPIVIISNWGSSPVSGTFKDLDEFAGYADDDSITLNGVVYRITYHYGVNGVALLGRTLDRYIHGGHDGRHGHLGHLVGRRR